MSGSSLVTFVGVAHPWMCDVNGHLNVRHYMAMFDDASFQLLAHVAPANTTAGLGWADVRAEIDYVEEVRAGNALTIVSQVERVGRSSLAILHTMTITGEDRTRARARIVIVRFDLDGRSSVELSSEERHRAEALLKQPSGSESANGPQGTLRHRL